MNRVISWMCRAGLATVVAVGAVALPAAPASACSCVPFDDAVRMSSPAVAFIGEVTEEQMVAANGFGEAQVALLYQVETVFHGDVPSQVVVHSPADTGGGCGLGFRGRTAVLAFVENDGDLTTNICSAAPVDLADADTTALLEQTFGQGRPPTAIDGADPGGSDGWPVGLLVGAGIFVVALAGSSVLLLRRQD